MSFLFSHLTSSTSNDDLYTYNPENRGLWDDVMNNDHSTVPTDDTTAGDSSSTSAGILEGLSRSISSSRESTAEQQVSLSSEASRRNPLLSSDRTNGSRNASSSNDNDQQQYDNQLKRSISLDSSVSLSLKKVLHSFNIHTSALFSTIINVMPCTTAITYHIYELPYHMPPEIYKFSFVPVEGNAGGGGRQTKKTSSHHAGGMARVRLLKRKTSSWAAAGTCHNHSEQLPSWDESISLDDSSKSGAPIITTQSIENHSFLQYFLEKKMYPKVEFEVFDQDISHRDIFNLTNYGVHVEDWENDDEETNDETNHSDDVSSSSSYSDGSSVHHDDVTNLAVYTDPKTKKRSFILNKKIKWLWILNCDCELLFCPEIQPKSSDTRSEVKHGDMVASQRHIGSIYHIISGRGPARIGGEFYFDQKRGKWCINNDSSYCFFRKDKLILSNGRDFKWQDYIDMLLRAFEIDTSELIWIDKVQRRQLDGYIMQNVAFRLQRRRNKSLKQCALDQFSQQQKSEELQIVKHFKDVNLADLMLGAFGMDTLFYTEGKLEINIIRGVNIPAVSKLLEFEYPKRYCKIRLMGCERVIQDKWWYKSECTKSIECKAEDTIFWHSPVYTFYVTSHQIEVLVVDIFQEPNLLLGSCFIDVRDLKDFESVTRWYPVVNTPKQKRTLKRANSQRTTPNKMASKTTHPDDVEATQEILTQLPKIGLTLSYMPHGGHHQSDENHRVLTTKEKISEKLIESDDDDEG